jgi:hypothetical protein
MFKAMAFQHLNRARHMLRIPNYKGPEIKNRSCAWIYQTLKHGISHIHIPQPSPSGAF